MELDPIPDDDTCIQTMAGQADRAVARWLADSREGLAEDSEYDESSRKGSLLSNSTESCTMSTSTESRLSSMIESTDSLKLSQLLNSSESQLLNSTESEGPQMPPFISFPKVVLVRRNSAPETGSQADLPGQPRRSSCPAKVWRGPRRSNVRGHRRDEVVYSVDFSD
eukprot:TRINITY_DN19032_c0_g1_i1.p1 TRINITY_DN19032_c0_g1~~TRINITY_DN19032_c0_g1_i1.p1  ORF type:complete len:167 (-),score=21.26 TRINITY_DN19032_c0_g1_i1:219-719(-)